MPLNKIDLFRDILEENAYRLTDRRNMSDYVPFIKDEQNLICQEIEGKQLLSLMVHHDLEKPRQ